MLGRGLLGATSGGGMILFGPDGERAIHGRYGSLGGLTSSNN